MRNPYYTVRRGKVAGRYKTHKSAKGRIRSLAREADALRRAGHRVSIQDHILYSKRRLGYGEKFRVNPSKVRIMKSGSMLEVAKLMGWIASAKIPRRAMTIMPTASREWGLYIEKKWAQPAYRAFKTVISNLRARRARKNVTLGEGMKWATVRKATNNFLYAFTKNVYFDGVPIQEMQDFLRAHGADLLDDEGYPFKGFILGREGRTTFPISFKGEVVNSKLALQWYKMPSGRFEVVAYVS